MDEFIGLFAALLGESREAVEKEIEERKEKFEAELISIEKRMTQDLDRRRSGGRNDAETLNQVKREVLIKFVVLPLDTY